MQPICSQSPFSFSCCHTCLTYSVRNVPLTIQQEILRILDLCLHEASNLCDVESLAAVSGAAGAGAGRRAGRHSVPPWRSAVHQEVAWHRGAAAEPHSGARLGRPALMPCPAASPAALRPLHGRFGVLVLSIGLGFMVKAH